jgi:hypothetical protein
MARRDEEEREMEKKRLCPPTRLSCKACLHTYDLALSSSPASFACLSAAFPLSPDGTPAANACLSRTLLFGQLARRHMAQGIFQLFRGVVRIPHLRDVGWVTLTSHAFL